MICRVDFTDLTACCGRNSYRRGADYYFMEDDVHVVGRITARVVICALSLKHWKSSRNGLRVPLQRTSAEDSR